MKVLIVGGGGREHALAWKAAQSPKVDQVYVAPGNAGTALEDGIENINIGAEDIPALLDFAKNNNIGLTIVGPEAALVAGIVDEFSAAGISLSENPEEIDRICAQEKKIMPVLVEINSGREKQKFGVMPEEAEELIKGISHLNNIKIMGLMTLGPFSGNPELARPYFSETKRIFDKIRGLDLNGVEMKYLSMAMTNSYQIAIEQGANIVRIGSKIFGEQEK